MSKKANQSMQLTATAWTTFDDCNLSPGAALAQKPQLILVSLDLTHHEFGDH
jgi:hypothetical protein